MSDDYVIDEVDYSRYLKEGEQVHFQNRYRREAPVFTDDDATLSVDDLCQKYRLHSSVTSVSVKVGSLTNFFLIRGLQTDIVRNNHAMFTVRTDTSIMRYFSGTWYNGKF